MLNGLLLLIQADQNQGCRIRLTAVVPLARILHSIEDLTRFLVLARHGVSVPQRSSRNVMMPVVEGQRFNAFYLGTRLFKLDVGQRLNCSHDRPVPTAGPELLNLVEGIGVIA